MLLMTVLLNTELNKLTETFHAWSDTSIKHSITIDDEEGCNVNGVAVEVCDCNIIFSSGEVIRYVVQLVDIWNTVNEDKALKIIRDDELIKTLSLDLDRIYEDDHLLINYIKNEVIRRIR